MISATPNAVFAYGDQRVNAVRRVTRGVESERGEFERFWERTGSRRIRQIFPVVPEQPPLRRHGRFVLVPQYRRVN
jgi:hypothetical protein